MRKLLFACITFLTVVPVAAAPPAQRYAEDAAPPGFADPQRRAKLANTFPAIDAIVEEVHRTKKLPGISYGIVIDGELAHARGFGAVDLAKPGVPDADTVYRIGSLTKAFTGLVIVSLRDQGKLSLEDPLVRYLPEAAGLVYPTRDAPLLTLRQVLNHTSGLPRLGPFDYTRPDRDVPEAEILRGLDGLGLDSAPGTAMVYSNLGYGLLGLVAARAGGAPYRQLMQERVLGPLGMTSTASPKLRAAMERLLALYTRFDETAYRETLTASRSASDMQVERDELAGYKRLHGACGAGDPVAITSPTEGRFAWKCERGRLEMEVTVDGVGRVGGFSGFSSRIAVPPTLSSAATRVAALVKRWDEKAYRQLLARKLAHDDATAGFARLRRERGSCRIASLQSLSLVSATFELDCERGPDAILVLGLAAGTFELESVRIVAAQDGPCRVD